MRAALRLPRDALASNDFHGGIRPAVTSGEVVRLARGRVAVAAVRARGVKGPVVRGDYGIPMRKDLRLHSG